MGLKDHHHPLEAETALFELSWNGVSSTGPGWGTVFNSKTQGLRLY